MAEEDEFNSSGWQLMESDPGVFSELLSRLGVNAVVDDLYSLDPESLAAMQPLHALVFLFKWIPGSNSDANSSVLGKPDSDFGGFFAHQVVNNACATLAVMNALGNIPSLSSGQQLKDLMSFAAGMDPQTSGMVITSSDWLREVHNALTPPSAVSLDGLGLPRQQSEDVYHFIVYVPVAGVLYELDGLKQHPVSHGAYQDSGEGWVAKAREVIEARISTYPPGSLDFSLLALRDDPLPGLQAELVRLQNSGDQSGVADVVVRIANENNKRERWNFENSLRKHNHLGMMHALLHALAKAGKLDTATEAAKKAMSERIERKRARGESIDDD